MDLKYDFHIHSCLSACGDDDMTPGNIAGLASLLGLDVIALTDHNSCRNCPSIIAQAKQFDLLVIPGMELTTSEEVHVVMLFDSLENALACDSYVYEHLQKIANRPDIFGNQYIMDESDEVCGTEPNLLSNATDISFDKVGALCERFGAVMIPAHVEKDGSGLLGNLGFIPSDSTFTCAEVKNLSKLPELLTLHPYLNRCRIISDSDAHHPEGLPVEPHTIEVRERTAKAVLAALAGN